MIINPFFRKFFNVIDKFVTLIMLIFSKAPEADFANEPLISAL